MGESFSLSSLQRDLLQAWFARSQAYFLTGGGALIGFYGLPRATQDLDLFTTSAEDFARVADMFHDCCKELGVPGAAVITSPHFRRFRLERDRKSVV